MLIYLPQTTVEPICAPFLLDKETVKALQSSLHIAVKTTTIVMPMIYPRLLFFFFHKYNRNPKQKLKPKATKP
jgi:hypothetical protein